MPRMYELTDEYVSLLAQYEEAQSDGEREAILEALGNAESNIVEKAENYARIIQNYEADADALANEIARLRNKKAVAENAVKRLKEYLLFAMEIAGATEIKTSIGKWRVQKNPMSVIITDADRVPARFLVEQPPVIDKRAMLAEFKQTGELFDGVEFVQSEGVRFR